MKMTRLSMPQVEILAITRVILGGGIGLLIHNKLRAKQRATIGWTCLSIGLLTTVPLLLQVYGGSRE